MFVPSVDDRLIDFGDGRKLERIGGHLVDRPCPAANSVPRQKSTSIWNQADFIFAASYDPAWVRRSSDDRWEYVHRHFRLKLRCTPAGQVGVFPEQAKNWNWFADRLQAQRVNSLRCLNLFAYTGAMTLLLARFGCEVVHVDASHPAIDWARENAQLSGLADARIRWIQEDARKFVDRELRRRSRYDIVILDPPSYGHGPKGEAWQIEDHVGELLLKCVDLLASNPIAMLWTGHSESRSIEHWFAETTHAVRDKLPGSSGIKRSQLVDETGRALDCGYSVRWSMIRNQALRTDNQ